MSSEAELEQFVRQQVGPALMAGEVMGPCAYLMPVVGKSGSKIGSFVEAATKMAAFAVLTDRRLILIHTRIGAFRPLLENHGLVSYPRESVKGVFVGSSLVLELADGAMLEFVNNSAKKYVSTQAEFFRRLQEVFGLSQAAAALVRGEKRATLLGFVLVLLATAAYVWYRAR